MYFYSLDGNKIELAPAGAEDIQGHLSDAVDVTEAASAITEVAHDAMRLSRATLTFFGSPTADGSLRMAGPRRPPSIYRDVSTNLLRCFYRELVIRFRPQV